MALLIVSGCASSPAEDSARDSASMEDVVSLMRGTVTYDYEPYPTPRAMLHDDGTDIAVVGTVESVEPAFLAGGPEPLGAVVVGLDPVETWKDDPSDRSASVFYWFHRPTNLGIERYRAAMPDGTRVVLFGSDVLSTPGFTRGDPGTTVYQPLPQGLFLPVPDHGLVNVWGDDIADGDWDRLHTVDDLRTAVRR
ncbi:MAG: hypothetical protein ACRDO7_00250 [Nocardioidaceae bacterium]